jgi:hypothetical protein
MPLFVEDELKTVAPIELSRVDLVIAEMHQSPLAKLRDPRRLEFCLMPTPTDRKFLGMGAVDFS